MIIDDISNISKYRPIISDKVLEFLQQLSSDTLTGHYEIAEGVFANVDEYEPKSYQNCKFEAHKKYIDIQMILSGAEALEYSPVKELSVIVQYDEKKDVMFFSNPESEADKVRLTPLKFVFIYPHEAHKPQIKTTTGLVKKVVVKIPV
jgi:YhcH/YjgK/YiaL family protein